MNKLVDKSKILHAVDDKILNFMLLNNPSEKEYTK